MPTSSERLVAYSVVVHLGRTVTQPVSEARRSEHCWLARIVANSPVEPRPRPDSAYLSLEQLSDAPARIREHLVVPADLPDDAIVILDLADAPYEFLNERFLRELSGVALEFVAGTARTLLLLLSRHPNDASCLWSTFDGHAWNGSTRVIVLDNNGSVRSFTARRQGTFKTLRDRWPEHRARTAGSVHDRFVDKVIARLGHFRLGEDPALCGRFYFDYSLAGTELVELLADRLAKRFTKTKLAQATLLLCGSRSDGLDAAVTAVAKRVGARWGRVDRADELAEHAASSTNILIFEVIGSGATLQAFRKQVSDASLPVERYCLAVLATGSTALKENPLRVDALHKVEQLSVERSACEQCLDGAQFTDPSADDSQVAISADDMWWMLDQVRWDRETYGPDGHSRYPFIPDLSEVFDRWGGWIAYKYALLLKVLGHAEVLAVVCPKEAAVLQLVDKLSVRFEGQLVAIAVPRDTLDDVKRDPARATEIAAAVSDDDADDWKRQLRDRSRKQDPVLVLDEFNSSGGTARDVTQLVKAFGVEVAAYLPFLDWGTQRPLPQLATRALYGFPNPRPEPVA